MRTTSISALAMLLGATALSATLAAPSYARPGPATGTDCPATAVHAGARGHGETIGHGDDHREVAVEEQRAITRHTKAQLEAQGITRAELRATKIAVPVFVHVMAAADGTGDVTDQQIADQIAVLNRSYAGEKAAGAANTGFRFFLAGTDRFYNNKWHRDRASATYRRLTRRGGPKAMNMWLVEFDYLGVATFPWDFATQGRIDGIRVHWDSLPGGSIGNYNLGETATHEAGHWLGLFHTFHGGCTQLNDEVEDTPAQDGPSEGCPEGRDSCALPGLDPIHNFMDYSFDDCYTEFTPGQAARAKGMWKVYRD